MVQIFVNSGRIIFRQEYTDENHPIPEYKRTASDEAKKSNYQPNFDDRLGTAFVPFRDWDRNDAGEPKRVRLNHDLKGTENLGLAEDNSNHRDEGIASVDSSGSADSVQKLHTNIDSGSDPETMQVEMDIVENPSRETIRPVANQSNSETNTAGTFTSSNTSAVPYSSSNFAARSVGELRQLAAQFDVDLSGCIEKKDMIDKLISALI